MADRTYTREEMEEIFRRAAEHTTLKQDGAGAIRYEDLVAAASEVGIDAAAVESVARRVEAERAELARRSDDDQVVAREVSERRHRARRSLLTYTVVCAFLAAIDFLTPGGPWAYWVALVWGLFVALGFGRAMLAPSEGDRARILRREHKRREKAARREQRERAARELKARLHAQQEAVRRELAMRSQRNAELQQASREFERSVEEGVTALLSVLAKRIDQAARGAGDEQGPIGDFGAFVTREKQRTSGGAQPPSVRVRVEEPARGPESASTDASGHVDEALEEAEKRARRRA
jgi:hypothetical protein